MTWHRTRNRTWLGLLPAVVTLLGSAAHAPAHQQHKFGNVFHDATLDDVSALARDECKLVLLYVADSSNQGPRYLEKPSRAEWRTIRFLLSETVPLKMRADRYQDELRQYDQLEVPALLLLEQDGRERRRFPGDIPATRLVEELRKELSGPDAVARAKAWFEKEHQGIELLLAPLRLADALARNGRPADALPRALEVFEPCLPGHLPGTEMARDAAYGTIIRLAERHPPARDALLQHRSDAEHAIRNKPDDARLARGLAELNDALGQSERNLKLYDAIPKTSRAGQILYTYVVDQLIDQRRYAEVLAIMDPAREFREQVRWATMYGGMNDTGPESAGIYGTKAFAVARGARLVEALAASDRTAEAITLVDAVLRFDRRPVTGKLLLEHAQRAGAEAVTAHIRSRGKPATETP